MSIFNELLPRILDISNKSAKNINDGLEDILELFDKFEDGLNRRNNNARDKVQKDKPQITTLQSINEDDDEPNKDANTRNDNIKVQSNDNVTCRSSTEAVGIINKPSTEPEAPRASKKRGKTEVEDMTSPGLDKRQKRNASVRAQTIISKQVNVNLTQKMRREDSPDKKSHGRRRKEDDKENAVPLLQIKQEKISLPPEPEPMEAEPRPVPPLALKRERSDDGAAMPPPAEPVPRPRRAPLKQRSEDSCDETGGRRRGAALAQDDGMPPPPVPSARSTRNSARRTATAAGEEPPAPAPAQARPKRTRGKKKLSEPQPSIESDNESRLQENTIGSPAEKPRPKRTRRAQKAAEKDIQTQKSQDSQDSGTEPETVTPKVEPMSQPEPQRAPLLPKTVKNKKLQKQDSAELGTAGIDGKGKKVVKQSSVEEVDGQTTTNLTKEGARVVLEKMNMTITLDRTVVLTNGVYNHAQVTPKSVSNVNDDTLVLESLSRDTMVLDKPHHAIMDATVVLERDTNGNMTQDASLLTDDNSEGERTPPAQRAPPQPASAVKEKVQQFEELAARTTRTKTRAMARMEDGDSHTPPERAPKAALSADTLSKMNSLIFNGKPPQVSSSGNKPRLPPLQKPATASASKLSSLQRHRAAADELLKKEDARGKKEALLEAKREYQRKKREEKMAAAAAAREAAERERRLAMEAAARGRQEKQAHADLGKLERLREVERKKLELARKAAETEERRRAEELARQQRLADELRRAAAAQRKQQEEAAALKKETAMMDKEYEKRQKEYMEKQKKKHDKMHTPAKGACAPLEPVYMSDGFQYLHSDEEQSPPRPVPAWSSSKMRKVALQVQSRIRNSLTETWFGVRVYSPDLREIFPAIDRSQLHRTSSAVWRTPPAQRLPTLAE